MVGAMLIGGRPLRRGRMGENGWMCGLRRRGDVGDLVEGARGGPFLKRERGWKTERKQERAAVVTVGCCICNAEEPPAPICCRQRGPTSQCSTLGAMQRGNNPGAHKRSQQAARDGPQCCANLGSAGRR